MKEWQVIMARKKPGEAPDTDVEETRDSIVRMAHRLFMEQGYRAVSTRQIADACGLTQPALYHYFRDKQGLYTEVIKEDIAKTRTALERIARRSDSVPERLRQVVRYLRSNADYDLGMMLHDMRQELGQQERITLHTLFQEGIIMPIASIFEDGLKQGLLRPPQQSGVDAYTATHLFMSMLSRFIARPDKERRGIYTSDAEQAEVIVHILLYGLAQPAPPEQTGADR